MFNGDSVKILKDVLKFKTGKRIASSTVDPSAVATAGEPGDLLINASKIFIKKDSGSSTNWDFVVDDASLATSLSNYVLTSQLGMPSGVATLDAGGKLTAAEVPAIAITDTFVVASQAAQTALTAEVGDVAVRTDQNKSYILVSTPASTFGNWQELLTPTDTVLSVFSRTGVVTAQNGDYTASQVTNVPSGNLAATEVQAALNELQSDVDSRATATALTDHINDVTDAHDASAISSVPSGNLAATDVQAALNELQTDVNGRATTALDNLASVAINASLLPGTDNTINLGSASKRYTTTYTQELRDASAALVYSITGRTLYDTAGNASIIHTSATEVSVNGRKVTNLGTPVATTDATTKDYVDSAISVASPTNYILNPKAVVDTTGWATYADAAGTAPVNGIGGTPNSTWTRSTTTPLSGPGQFIFTHNSGASRQGEGASYDFTIDNGDQAKVLQISFDYKLVSGTFVAGSSTTDSDLTVWIYDVTNNVVIQPSSYKLLSNSSTVSDRFIANFQTASNSTSYRLIIHNGTTVNAQFVMAFDNFSTGPSNYVYGTPITDWVSYTPTLTNLTLGNGTSSGYWRRVGDSIEINYSFKLGSTSSVGAAPTFSIPSGLTFDTSKYTSPNGDFTVGYGKAYDSGTDAYEVIVDLSGSNALYLRVIKRQGADYLDFPNFSSTVPFTWTTNDAFTIRTFLIPITGWSSSTQVSDGYDGRIIAARYYASTGASMGTLSGSFSDVTFNTREIDTTASFSGATYTIPSSGYYKFSGQIYTNGSSTANALVQTKLLVDGSVNYSETITNQSSTVAAVGALYNHGPFFFRAGQTVKLQAASNLTSPSYGNGTTQNYIQIEKLQAPTTISATEVVVESYFRSSNQSLTADVTAIVYDSMEQSTHGAYNSSTGTFTAPYPGFYLISGSYTVSAVSDVYAYIDGTKYKRLGGAPSANSSSLSGIIKLNAGQALTLRSNTTATLTGNTLANGGANISFTRIK